MTSKHSDDPTLDIDGIIDFDALKAQVKKQGPLAVVGQESTVQIKIDVVSSESTGGHEDLIVVVLLSGATSLSTFVPRTVFEGYPSIGEFAERYFREPHLLFEPSGELSYIKEQIDEHLGVDVDELFAKGVPADGIATKPSEKALADAWMENNLIVTLNALLERCRMREGVSLINGEQTVRESFPSPNDLLLLMEQHYNLGFLTARLVSENFVRYQIEPLAVKGLAFDAAQDKRTAASSKSSTKKRHQRVEATLTAMETLCAENPAIGRLGIKSIADLAIEDCVKANLQLWRQGKGRRDEYLAEMKSDLKYQARFVKLKSKTA
jgi:hypothetical protein